MLSSISIQGDGVAACCCARLLAKRGLPVTVQKASRPNLPSLLVSTSTQNLMVDVFGDESLFAGFPTIRKRTVLWRNQSEPVTVAHSGVVAAESILLERLWSNLEQLSPSADQPDSNEGNWVILSSKSGTNGYSHCFGSRSAIASAVELQAGTDPEACWVEALNGGWLFLLPTSRERASLISVGDTVSALLGQSRLVVDQVKSILSSTSGFPAYPRVLDPLCGRGWLACGTSAMGFDPICGEGAGNAVREAILLSAGLGFVAQGSEPEPVLEHYSTRLLGGFLKHLHLCRDFYSCGPDRDWWNGELKLLEQGITWTQQKLSGTLQPASMPRFRLVGFDLQPIN